MDGMALQFAELLIPVLVQRLQKLYTISDTQDI